MLPDHGTRNGRWRAAAQTLKIFVLPPLLTLALVACSLMVFTSYLAQRSLQTTYVISNMRQRGFCGLCHDGTFTRSPALKLGALPQPGAARRSF